MTKPASRTKLPLNIDTGRIITVLIITIIIVGVLAPSYNSIRKVNAITGGVGDPTGEMKLPTGFGSSLTVNQANDELTKSAADSVIATIPDNNNNNSRIYQM